jgi:hypothetical protein
MAKRRYDDEDDDFDDDTGIEVTTSFFPLAWILYLCTPRIEVDGEVFIKPWGTHFIPLDPGRYDISIYFPYLFMSRCGEARIRIKLRAGEVARIEFWMPPWMMMGGSIREVD